MRKLLLSLIPALFLLSSCEFIGGERIRGNGNITSASRDLGNFEGVRTSGSFDTEISTGNEYTVRVETDENLHEYVETLVEDNILRVKTRDGYSLSSDKGVRLYITAPSYRVARISGSGSMISRNRITSTSAMDIGISGSGDIQLDIDAPEASSEISGSGKVVLNGQTKTFKAEINGGGEVKAFDLRAEEATIDINGSGEVEVFASVNLNVNVRGSGDVKYKGGANVKSDIKGSGDVVKAD